MSNKCHVLGLSDLKKKVVETILHKYDAMNLTFKTQLKLLNVSFVL